MKHYKKEIKYEKIEFEEYTHSTCDRCDKILSKGDRLNKPEKIFIGDSNDGWEAEICAECREILISLLRDKGVHFEWID